MKKTKKLDPKAFDYQKDHPPTIVQTGQKDKLYEEFKDQYDKVRIVHDAKKEQIKIAKQAVENLKKIKNEEVVPVEVQ